MATLKYQLILFRTALMFLTRIPVGKNLPYSTTHLQSAARYFSWVGFLVGLIGALVLVIVNLYFSSALSIAFSMLATIILTGAFHEDGLADCCDAFGGGWTKEKILTIMKDSRLGTYGVIGLIASLSVKYLLLNELCAAFHFPFVGLILIAAHSSSRFFAVSIMQTYSYVQDIDLSKSKPLADRKLNFKEMIVLLIGTIIPLLLLYIGIAPNWLNPSGYSIHFTYSTLYLFPLFIVIIILPACIIRYFAGRFFNKWIGGYTGDCLGTTQQLTEIAFYIGCLLLWRFI
jgi:adenosylcobinamide-GDP ribazoletransferase